MRCQNRADRPKSRKIYLPLCGLEQCNWSKLCLCKKMHWNESTIGKHKDNVVSVGFRCDCWHQVNIPECSEGVYGVRNEDGTYDVDVPEAHVLISISNTRNVSNNDL